MRRRLRPLSCSLLLLSTGLWAQGNKGFLSLASTIGPIDLGVVDAQNAYTVIDRASCLGTRDRIKLAMLVEGDEILLNHSSLIPVNPASCHFFKERA